jgi:1-deoxy-D-xylulose-5-phosphate synthase
MGLPDRFLNHGSRGELLADCGLDAAGIVSRVTAVLDQPIAARPAVG